MINADALNKAGVDYNAGLKRFMNDPELYEMVLAAFARADIAQRARAAYDANDRETLLKVVHEAKGSGGNAGLDKVYVEASALVKMLRSHDYTDDELTQGFERFESAYMTICDAVKASLEQN